MGVKLSKTYNHYREGHGLLAGAAADTNIAVAGIVVGDELLKVHEIQATGETTDILSTTSITSNGNIQCTGDTTGDQLSIVWASKQ